MAEDGFSLSVEITGGNRREAAEGLHLPMVFPVTEGAEVEGNEGSGAIRRAGWGSG